MTSKREKLARAYLAWKWQGERKQRLPNATVTAIMRAKTKRNLWWYEKQMAFAAVDALLAELREPAEGMLEAGGSQLPEPRPDESFSCKPIWQAMIDAIKNA